MTLPVPYIGVTGIFTRKVADGFSARFVDGSKRKFMVGVLASKQTLEGKEDKYPLRYPRISNIGKIFPENPNTISLIHFYAENSNNLFSQLRELTRYGGTNLDGFQLNMVWPDPDMIEKYLRENEEMKIVLQVNSKALELVNNNPVKLAKKIKSEYKEIIDYILIDSSEGKGVPLNAKKSIEYLGGLSTMVPEVGLVVAGGLCAETLHLVADIVQEFPNISIDAEGKLRDKYDLLDVWKAKFYIDESLKLLCS